MDFLKRKRNEIAKPEVRQNDWSAMARDAAAPTQQSKALTSDDAARIKAFNRFIEDVFGDAFKAIAEGLWGGLLVKTAEQKGAEAINHVMWNDYRINHVAREHQYNPNYHKFNQTYINKIGNHKFADIIVGCKGSILDGKVDKEKTGYYASMEITTDAPKVISDTFEWLQKIDNNRSGLYRITGYSIFTQPFEKLPDLVECINGILQLTELQQISFMSKSSESSYSVRESSKAAENKGITALTLSNPATSKPKGQALVRKDDANKAYDLTIKKPDNLPGTSLIHRSSQGSALLKGGQDQGINGLIKR